MGTAVPRAIMNHTQSNFWMIGCWTSTRGERGPWSAAVSETIRS